MKIKIQELKDLLNLEEKDLKKLSLEQLRLLLGVCHYLARITLREINVRTNDFSVEKITAKQSASKKSK